MRLLEFQRSNRVDEGPIRSYIFEIRFSLQHFGGFSQISAVQFVNIKKSEIIETILQDL